MAIYITIMGWADGSTQVNLSTTPVEVDGVATLACEEYILSDSDEKPTLRILEALLRFPGDDASSIETQLTHITTRAAELYHEVMQKEEVTTE